MRYLATMLVAVCFFLNSLVGIVGTVVVCIHKDIVHISAAPNHCCSFYGNIHSGNSIGQDARCSAPSDCFDLLVGDGNSIKLASERMKLPQPTIFALSVPPNSNLQLRRADLYQRILQNAFFGRILLVERERRCRL